ncbi:hypothetical protein [Flagellimonas nanhaiensis]|uniref:Uncharacterized protein n=1 Tax=Flagellimonas nanhaiensis TaxID=2292706 RepID=A0A371JMU6_9FLAO|nr:hypothetical protein [Allomuricauda nanhaiensis]RDY58468.1 hypothetical protein DX873_15825 [Allomuricauda nanhaiensis]
MCSFKEHNYGRPLPESMVAFLTEYIHKKDVQEIAELHLVSFSTVNLVRYGHTNLAKSNAKAIKALMKRAVENCGRLHTQSGEDIKTFDKIMADEMA